MEITSFFPFLILMSMVVCLGKAQMESEKVALLAFKSSVGKSLLWKERDSPCSWNGIVCQQGLVVELRLPRFGLTGTIPKDTIGKLTKLRTLDLSFNDLNGQIPEDTGKCADLENVLFQGNHLSGEIPSSIFLLRNLIRLNLAGNKFTGNVSPQFQTLIKLNTLYLENNQLTGFLPDLSFANLLQFNVSYNQLMGSVPKSLEKFGQNAFLGTSLCLEEFFVEDAIVHFTSIKASRKSGGKSRRRSIRKSCRSTTRSRPMKKSVLIGIIIASVIVGIFLAIVVYIYISSRYSDKSKQTTQTETPDIEKAEDGEHDPTTKEEIPISDALNQGKIA